MPLSGVVLLGGLCGAGVVEVGPAQAMLFEQLILRLLGGAVLGPVEDLDGVEVGPLAVLALGGEDDGDAVVGVVPADASVRGSGQGAGVAVAGPLRDDDQAAAVAVICCLVDADSAPLVSGSAELAQGGAGAGVDDVPRGI